MKSRWGQSKDVKITLNDIHDVTDVTEYDILRRL